MTIIEAVVLAIFLFAAVLGFARAMGANLSQPDQP
jgi:hypothetical protein